MLKSVECPYCGECFESTIEPEDGSQHYIEDCAVCCRPIEFRMQVDTDGEHVKLTVYRDDEC